MSEPTSLPDVEAVASAPPARPIGGRREIVFRIVLILGSILMALIVGEIGARFVARVKGVDFTLYMKELTNSDRLPKSLQMEHPTLRWTLNPGEKVLATTSDFSVVYSVNSKGLRDQYYPYKKPDDKIRAVALGDSYTFGEGIPYGERYTDIPESSFRNLEVLTMGAPGYGLDQMLLTLAEEGVKYHPDLVILCIASSVLTRHSLGANWVDSAPIDSIAKDSWTDGGPSPTVFRREGDSLLSGDRNFILRHSYLLSYLYYKGTLIALRRRMQATDQKMWSGRIMVDTALQPDDAAAEKQADYLSKGVRRLGAMAAEFKFRVVLVNIDPSLNFRIPPEVLPPGALVLDFSAELRAEAARRNLRFKYDRHYNPETNHFLGKRLAASLGAALPELLPVK